MALTEERLLPLAVFWGQVRVLRYADLRRYVYRWSWVGKEGRGPRQNSRQWAVGNSNQLAVQCIAE